MSKALEDIAAERKRQIEVEGWTPEHDDEHYLKQMSLAAASYAAFGDICDTPGIPPGLWPWDRSWWKPTDYRRNLVKAGALIAAEIERVDRLGPEE